MANQRGLQVIGQRLNLILSQRSLEVFSGDSPDQIHIPQSPLEGMDWRERWL